MKNSLVTWLVAAVIACVASFGVIALDKGAVVQVKSGALAGPIIPFPYIQWGGVTRWAAIDNFAASSTVCAIQAPAATSTLKSATMLFFSAPAYSTSYEIGESTTLNSTSTPIVASYTSGAGGTISQIIATTTVTALPDGIVPPNAWINFNLSTSTASGMNQATGECTATFDQI